MAGTSALWLRAHRPILEELHDAQQSLRTHAVDLARITREGVSASAARIENASRLLDVDRVRLSSLCRVLTSVTPPPDGAAARAFDRAVDHLRQAVDATSLGTLITRFEEGSADMRDVEAALGGEPADSSPAT